MVTILGIDAAWTDHVPSGVALVRQESSGWRCLVAAPTYASFISFAGGQAIDWGAGHSTKQAELSHLIEAATAIGGRPDILSVDMPLSRTPIDGRRAADQAISRAFGQAGASTHSPNAQRPGPVSARLCAHAQLLGYPLKTATLGNDQPSPSLPALIETYPHPVIIQLMGLTQRLPYKVSKSTRYWPKSTIAVRRANLLSRFVRLKSTLALEMGEIPIPLPAELDARSLQSLKCFEDALDAVVCCWTGICYATGNAMFWGDQDAAIWLPAASS